MKSKKSSAVTAYRFAASIRIWAVKKTNAESVVSRLHNTISRATDYKSSVARKKHFSYVLFLSNCIILSLIFLIGCNKRDIARPTPQIDAGPDFWIRVILINNATSSSLLVKSPCTVSQNLPTEASTHLEPATSALNITAENGTFTIGNNKFSSPQITVIPQSPYIFNLNGSDYRGKLMLSANPDGSSYDVINIVPLEPYLAGVVGAEMPSYWERAALEAQAVAARTYCLYIKRHYGSNRNWDVTRTQSSQVYLGVSAETKSVWQAVNKTKGQVLVCTQPDGASDLLPAYYSSSCGGHTENSQAVLGGDFFEPLKGVPCPYCRSVAKPDYFFWTDILFSKKAVSEKLIQKYPTLANLESITSIIPIKQSDYTVNAGQQLLTISRLTFLKLIGSNGKTSFVKAEDLRMTIDPSGEIFKSTVCKIQDANDKWLITGGRGFGHGCGLCQCGAQALARFESKTAAQILSYYYPNSKIAYVY